MRDVLEKAKNMSKYKLKAEVAISSEQYNKQILLNKRFFRELGGYAVFKADGGHSLS